MRGIAAQVYETVLVPAVFEEWAQKLLAAGQVGPGDRVLDVACGTGVVARRAVKVVGLDGSVVGVDLTEAMLALAERIEPEVEWRLGDAMDLPFDVGSFDVVLCQAGLMFFPDRVHALEEMRRVLRPGGRLAVQVWGTAAAQDAFADVVERYGGSDVADRYRAPWSFPDPDELMTNVTAAGFTDVAVRIEPGMNRFGSLEEFLSSTEFLLAGHVDTQELAADTAEALAPYHTPEGTLNLPAPGNIATARKP